MSSHAWVGAERQQVGQGGAWKSFPTLHCAIVKMSYATTKPERLLCKRERRGREGNTQGTEGAAGRASSGTLGTNPAPCRTAKRVWRALGSSIS